VARFRTASFDFFFPSVRNACRNRSSDSSHPSSRAALRNSRTWFLSFAARFIIALTVCGAMPKVAYVAYIDESGDDGLTRVRPIDPDGATEWFVISAVVVAGDANVIL
jgi:hypothetical protein